MPLEAPNLDDYTFEQLLREARLRVNQYCPEWTDFNDSDPGMAIVQLFAWFTELMLYRLNQVPDLSYVKFLRMLNIQPRPRQPARAVVCFTPPRPARPLRRRELPAVPARARLEAAGDGGPVVFETVRPLDPVPYPLDAVQVFDGAAFSDESAANEQANARYRPLGWTPRVGGALYLGFQPPETDKGRQRTEFPDRIVVQVFLPQAGDRPAEPVRSAAALRPEQKLVWEYQSDFDLPPGQDRGNRPTDDPLTRWRRLETISDATAAFTREGAVEIRGPGPDILATRGGKPTPDGDPRFWVRCRFADGPPFPPDRVPEVAFLRVNAVAAENRATYADEVLGESDGFNRNYRLRNFPVDADSLVLEVEPAGDDPPETWERKDDLFGSGPNDRHFQVTPASGEVQFGDGRRGRTPPPGALVVARRYLAGGGAAGNVEAGAINSLPPGVGPMESVTNPRAAAGGTEEETVEQLRDVVPQLLRGGDGRAVTRSDYEKLAGQVTGVAKAAVLPKAHPDYPGLSVPGAVTVVVVPDGQPAARPARPAGPQPTQDLLDRVYRELDALRPLGTELFVAPPRYAAIEVRVRIDRVEGVSDSQARDGVEKAVEQYLSPVPQPPPRPAPALPAPAGRPPSGGPKRKPPEFPRGWPFDEPFIPSRLYGIVLAATDDDGRPLVRSVTDLAFTVNGQKGDIRTPYNFGPGELPVGRAEVEVQLPRTSGEERPE